MILSGLYFLDLCIFGIPYRALPMSQYSVGLARIRDLSITDLHLD